MRVLNSPRSQRRFFWVALVVLAAGVIAAAITFTGGSTSEAQPPPQTGPIKDVSKVPKTKKINAQAKRVAQRFILTAVARKHLEEAYPLAGPAIKQGQSLKEWMTGNIAVVPYPVDELDFAPMKIDYSYAREAMIQVALLPKKGSKVKPQLFSMTLQKLGNRWVVNGWVPRSTVPVPAAP